MLAERNRLALELHDVGQPEAVRPRAHGRGGGDAARPRRRTRRASRSSGCRSSRSEALDELRSLVFELRPAGPRARRPVRRAAQARRACCGACTARDRAATSTATPRPRRRRDAEVLRIAQEALNNALRHAAADARSGSLPAARRAASLLEVADDGAGFDPADPELRSRRLGLTSMEERARRARRPADDPTRRRARARRCGWRSAVAEPIRVLIVDDHAVVREGLRDVPRAPGRHRGRRRGRPTARRRSRRPSALRARRRPDGPRDAARSTASARCASCARRARPRA